MRIYNCKVKISSNALRFNELKHIEDQISSMEVCPDFGYEGDNYFLEKDEEAPRNWKLITEIISSKRKHEWLRNHIELRTIRKEQEKEEQERKVR